MTTEEQEYLEREYAEFEKNYFHGERFWRAPLHTLRDTVFYALFERFSELFPDHPNEYFDAFYLLQSGSGQYSILFRCAHFEHASSEDLPELAKFMDSAATSLTSSQGGNIELLNGNGEKLHIRFYSPHEHIVTLLKTHASRVFVEETKA